MNHTHPRYNGNRHLHDGDHWLQWKYRHLHQLSAQPWHVPRYSKHNFIPGSFVSMNQGPGPQLQSSGDALAENLSPCPWSEYNPNWIILLYFWQMTLNFPILLTITIVNSFYSAAKWGPYPEAFTQAEITDLLLRGRCKNILQMHVQHQTLKGIICHFLHY